MDKRYGFNSQEEGTWCNCDCETKEQAILEGKEYYLDEQRTHFFVGEVIETPVLNPLDADDLIEKAAELIDENYGGDWDPGERFYEHVEKEQIKDLQTMLEKVWESWIDKHNIKSHSFIIDNIEEINIDDGKTA